MNFNDYQAAAHATSKETKIGGDPLPYAVLGLCDEAGEVAGKVKKVYRDSNGNVSDADRAAIISELGDPLWYIAEIATVLGVTLEEVAQINLDKLASRQERGVIGGSGDDR